MGDKYINKYNAIKRIETLYDLNQYRGVYENSLIYLVELQTLYVYYNNSDAIIDNFTVLETANGGNSRWIGISGRYNYYSNQSESRLSYTPSIISSNNVNTVVFDSNIYSRVGYVVTVYGVVTVKTTTSGYASILITLPIVANFSVYTDLIGYGVSVSNNKNSTLTINADVMNMCANFNLIGDGTNNYQFNYSFQYLLE